MEEYMNSRKDDSNCSASGNSLSSWMWQCEKENLQLQRQEENETQCENLSDLANKLDDLTIRSTELEPHNERWDPEHQNKKPNPSLNEEDSISQSQIKEKLVKFSNQSHRHYSDIDTTAVEQSQKTTEHKSISVGQLYQNVWKNPLTDIPKDTKREQNYSNIFNPPRFTVYRQPSIKHKHILRKNPLANIPKDTDREQIYSKIVNLQCSYNTVYRESSINYQHLFCPVQLENKMERVKSVDAWIDKLSPYETKS